MIETVAIETLEKRLHDFDVEILRGGKFCSPTYFAEVWTWFYPLWLERDKD